MRYIDGVGHAEQTLVNALDSGGSWQMIAGGSSRNICSAICAPLLEFGAGMQFGGRVFRGLADKLPFRMFW